MEGVSYVLPVARSQPGDKVIAYKVAKVGATKYDAQFFANLFKSIGVPDAVVMFLVAQVALETQHFTSKLLYDHNNASGIIFINKPSVQKNATKGRPIPENSKYNYAMFNSIKDWAIDYNRVLHLGKAKPFEATTLADYVARLKANKYFSADINEYMRIIKDTYAKYKKFVPTVAVAGGSAIALLLIVGLAYAISR